MPKLAANDIVDLMAAKRQRFHPDETWTRDIPLGIQRRMFPDVQGIARESDNGRGAVFSDLYGIIPVCTGIVEEVVISVKSSRGAGRDHGRTASLTAGTMDHIRNVVAALMDETTDYPVVFVHQNSTSGAWAQTYFDAGRVLREVANKYSGDTEIPGVSWAGGGERGLPIILRETTRKGTDNLYYQMNFNMGVLVTPIGQPVSRMPGVVGLGLATPWRRVAEPEIEWGA